MLLLLLVLVFQLSQTTIDKLNYTFSEEAVEVQIDFQFMINKLNIVLISQSQLIDRCQQQIIQDDLKFKCNTTHQLFFDKDSILSGNKQHRILIPYSQQSYYLYISESLTYQIQYLSRKKQQCIQDCGNGKCQNTQCICEQNNVKKQFGQYCQLNGIIISKLELNIRIEPQCWSYYIKLNSSNIYQMDLMEISDDFQFSIRDGNRIPNLLDNYYYVNSNIKQKYLLKDLIKLDENEICIGFQNRNKKEVKFILKLSEYERKKEINKEYQVYIVIGLIVIISGSVLIFIQMRKSRQNNNIIIPRRRLRGNQKKIGFKVQTIFDHFPGYKYEILIGKYSSLSEMCECVICLETMKPSAEYVNMPTSLEEHQLMHQKDQSITSRAKSGELFICSVTPCFHMFHTRCLYSWLQNNTYCPLCRSQFNEQQIIKSKPWIELGDELSSRLSNRTFNNNNKYIARMKTKVQDQINPASELLSSQLQSKNNSEYIE